MQKSAVIEYKHDGHLCEGFAVWDDAGTKRPGILVFPEWGGVGEYTYKRAQMLGELGFNAEGERYVLARNVAAAKADGDGNVETVEGAENRVLKQGGRSTGRTAVEHFAKDNSQDTFKLSCLAQLPEHAVDLVRLDAGVFKKKERALSVRLPRRAQ